MSAERDELDQLLDRLAAEKIARDAANPPDDPEPEAEQPDPGSWSVWTLPIGAKVGADAGPSQFDNPEAKKKTKRANAGDEQDHYSLLFPGQELRYPEGFPRAEWDQPRVYDAQKPPGRSWTIYNYFTGGYEWHFAPLDIAPEDKQREYHPQGLTVAEERAASRARRAAHSGPVGALVRPQKKRFAFPPILPV